MTAIADPPHRAPGAASRRRFVVPALLLAAVVVIAVLLVLGRSADPGPPRITVTASAATPGGVGDMASVYVVITNEGGEDSVRSATSDAASVVTLHDTEEADGGAYMVDVDRLVVPADGTLTLTPGARHLMLHHLYEPLEAGDTVPLTLELERSGTIQVQVPVLPLVDLAGFGLER